MSNRKTPETPVANPAPTFSKEALDALVGQAVKQALEAQHAQFQAELAEARKAKPAAKSKTDDNIWRTRKAFVKAGYKAENVKPNENIFTFNIWMSKGRRVTEGQTAVKVSNLRLFHFDQTRAATKAELAEHQTKMTEKSAKTSDTWHPRHSRILS